MDQDNPSREAIAEAAREVLDIEGTAAEESTARQSRSSFTAILFRQEERPTSVALEDVPLLVQRDANFVWIDASDYGESEMKWLADLLDLARLSVHSVVSTWARPRLDVFRDGFFVSATVARLDRATLRVHASQLDLFVGENYLLSAHKLPLPFYNGIMARIEHNPELVRHDSAYMLYIVLDELLENYEGLYELVQDQVEQMEQRALTDASDDLLEDLVQLKRYAFALRQLADQHRPIFEAFLRPDFPFLSGEGVETYYRDLHGRLDRLLDSLSAAREAVNGAFDIYVSHVSHRTNNTIKVLTLVSTLLLPNWLILSFFSTGFNGVVPWLYTRASFAVMIALMMVVTAGVLVAFRRQHWI